MVLQQKIHAIISDTLWKQMKCSDEKIVIIYDEDSPLAKILANGYKHVLKDRDKNTTQIVKFDETKKEYFKTLLHSLEEGSSVFLIQSTSFRLDDFRIRLQLFNAGVGCMEHSHLSYYTGDQEETFLNALTWKGDEYDRLGKTVRNLLETSDEIRIFSGESDMLTFGQMEEAKINDGRFYAQKNRGGSSICGEVFSEAKDLEAVNGKLTIHCYPNSDFMIQKCTPFSIRLEKGRIVHVDKNAPAEFLENIIDRVRAGETNEDGESEVMIREAGFGLNPFISMENPLSYVSIFERQAGFHVSVGKKHNIYRKKFHKKIVQRYHIDIFADMKKMVAVKDGRETVFFENGKYCV